MDGISQELTDRIMKKRKLRRNEPLPTPPGQEDMDDLGWRERKRGK